LHKDGRWLIYAANLDAESGEEIETDRLYRHDLQTGERIVLATSAHRTRSRHPGSPTGGGSSSSPRLNLTGGWVCGVWTKSLCAGS
jgi:hypothetical protein